MTMDQFYRIDQVQQDLQDIPGIDVVEGWTFARCEVLEADDKPGEPVEMLGVSPVANLSLPFLSKDDGLFLEMKMPSFSVNVSNLHIRI